MTVAGGLRRGVYILNFLYSIQFGLALYFNSSFLSSQGYSKLTIGIVFALAYSLAIGILFVAPRLLRRFGNYKIFIGGTTLTGLIFCALSLSPAVFVAPLLAATIALSMTLYLSLDVFLETTSRDEGKTGFRRGFFTALINGAFIVAQLLAVLFLARGGFPLLYAATGFILIIISLLTAAMFRRFRDASYERPDWKMILRRIRRSRDVRNVYLVQFMLRLFYSVMVVYTPIYLHEYIGMSLSTMGTIFAVMLVPFILLETPLGRMEDRSWGEQEVLISGFVLVAVSTALLSLITTAGVVVWAIALLLTRVGAVCLDIGSEAYFFKHMNGSDSGELSAFRMLYPLAYIIGPLTSALLLLVFPIQYLFIALALVMLLGIIPTLALHDTR